MTTATSKVILGGFGDPARRPTGWVAIVGAVLAWATVGVFMAATQGDLGILLRPAQFLALPAAAHQQLVVAMVLDCLGFYLPFLVVGGYLWSRLRAADAAHGAAVDIAVLCIVSYALLGMAGASLLAATVQPLAAAHAAGDAAAKAGAEAAWLAVAYGVQHGLWLLEGPVMGFWGLAMGRALRAAGLPWGRLLMAVGVCYAAIFVAALLELVALVELLQFAFLLLLPLWSLLIGIHLLRQPRP